MQKKFFLILLIIILNVLQISLNLRDIRINLPLLLLVYLLFFYNVNYSLLVVGLSLIIDIFALNFGSYFIPLVLVCLILYYVYHNILTNDNFTTYILLNIFGLIIFNLIYYSYNSIFNIIRGGMYYFTWNIVLKDFLMSLSVNFILCLLIYLFVHIFSKKTKNKFIIIGDN